MIFKYTFDVLFVEMLGTTNFNYFSVWLLQKGQCLKSEAVTIEYEPEFESSLFASPVQENIDILKCKYCT